jgi:hypothetical protein
MNANLLRRKGKKKEKTAWSLYGGARGCHGPREGRRATALPMDGHGHAPAPPAVSPSRETRPAARSRFLPPLRYDTPAATKRERKPFSLSSRPQASAPTASARRSPTPQPREPASLSA